MELIQNTLKKIKPLDKQAMQTVKDSLQQRGLSGQLGYLENILLKYAGITRSTKLTAPHKKTIVVCADHGVAKMGVSAYPPETTVEMTRNYLVSKGAVANALSNFAGSSLSVIDMGIGAAAEDIPNLINKKIALGTNNIAEGPAMSRAQAILAINTGIELAEQYVKEGYTCFLPGEMGIANTTSSAAIVAVCGGLTAAAATGRGTNISDERLKLKISVVQQAITVNQPDANDGIDILSKIGGFEFGCIAGLMLGAAANQAVVMLDGFNTGASALIARAICPQITDYLIGSHLAAEQAHRTMLKLLNLEPYMKMDFRLGEATGSSIAINLLDCAISLFNASPEKLTPAKLEAAPADRYSTPVIKPLNKAVQDDCSLYIDNLAKPIHSLGRLEEFAIQLSGITGNARPANLKKALLYLTTSPEPLPAQTIAFAHHAEADLYPLYISDNSETNLMAVAAKIQQLTGKYQLIALTANGSSKLLLPILKTACQYIASGHAAIIPDNELVLAGLAAAIAENSLIADYALPPTRQHTANGAELENKIKFKPCLDLAIQSENGIGAALMLKIIDASLHMLNDMKTFGTAGVSVANDGPGAQRQDSSIQS